MPLERSAVPTPERGLPGFHFRATFGRSCLAEPGDRPIGAGGERDRATTIDG
jgi:hypothetical protein